MVIRKLILENFGRIEKQSFDFSDSLNVIMGEDPSVLLAALSVALCNRMLRFQLTRYCFQEKSRIYAEIRSGGTDYISETVYCGDAADHSETKMYCGGRRLTEEERSAIFQTSAEEEECSYFINPYDYARYVPFAELDFSRKLTQYRKALQGKNRQAFSERTAGAGITQSFQQELEKFCDAFFPQTIRLEKQLLLTIDEDGLLIAKDRFPRRGLSATEATLFQYFCFTEVNRFWGNVQNSMGRTVKKPLFLSRLPDEIDECIDLAPLLARALDLGRQTFLFTKDREIERRFGADMEKNTIFLKSCLL